MSKDPDQTSISARRRWFSSFNTHSYKHICMYMQISIKVFLTRVCVGGWRWGAAEILYKAEIPGCVCRGGTGCRGQYKVKVPASSLL